MRKTIQVVLVIVFFLFVGCSESFERQTYRSSDRYDAIEKQGTSAFISDGRFTISLAVYKHFDREQQAAQLKNRAQQLLKDNRVWIETLPDGLSVNYGHFATLAKAKRHLSKIKRIYSTLQPGHYQFFYAKEIPEPDPLAPAEWNIVNNNCFYSLQIATYYNVPDSEYFNRKQDAVEAVKNLRQAGDSAYYYHGYYESLVLIGCLPQNIAAPLVELLRQKHPWHYENSYSVYQIIPDSKLQKQRFQKKSFIVRIDDILQSP